MAKPEPEKRPDHTNAAETRILPMDLQPGDRITDETVVV